MPKTRTRGRARPREKYSKDYTKPVEAVLDNYIEACAYQPIGASRIGPYGDSKPRTNPFKMKEYKADVERGLGDALRNHLHLVPVLQSVLREMADEPFEPVSAGDRVALIQRLGPVFARLGLAPYHYFTLRREHVRRRS